MKKYKMLMAVMLLAVVWSCSGLKLTQTDFAWPVESVLKIDDQGVVTDNRFSFSVNVKQLFFTENADSLSYKSKDLRIIRDTKGYYYVTSEGFKNVYLFQVDEGAFKLYDTFLIDEKGITAPVMNQRLPYIELISGSNKYLLNNEGLKK